MSALPCAHGGPPLTGVLRATPEDFFVDEDLGFAADGAGEHVFVRVEKRGANTDFVAKELARYGGIDSVVPADKLLESAHELAGRIARHSPVAIRMAKRSLNRIEYMELKDGYAYEQSLTGELSGYDDAKEAVNAFFERRAPQYTGK